MKRLLLLAALAAAPAWSLPIIVGTITYSLVPETTNSINISVHGGLARDFIDVPITMLDFQINGFIDYGDVGQETIVASVGYVGLPPVLTGGSILATTIIGNDYPTLIGRRMEAAAQAIILQNPTFGLGEIGYLTVNATSLIAPEPGTFFLIMLVIVAIGICKLRHSGRTK